MPPTSRNPGKKGRRASTKPRPAIVRPVVSASVLQLDLVDEPLLEFGGGHVAIDPKEGIADSGPYTVGLQGRHPESLTLGLVGTDASIQGVSAWLDRCRQKVAAAAGQELLHPAFPGFSRASPFQSEVILREEWNERLTAREMDKLLELPGSAQRFQFAVDLVADKIEHLANRDTPPRVVALALPDQIIQLCWSVDAGALEAQRQRLSPIERRMLRRRREEERYGQGSLFGKLEPEIKRHLAYRNFRRAVKARAMRHNVPIQLLQAHSWALGEGVGRQPRCTVAWNLFTALYYKAGGFPWVLEALNPGECFVGVSFHRSVSDPSRGMYSSLAQVFSNRSEGLVLRGDRFEWDEKALGRAPHLKYEDAAALVRRVVQTYEREHQHKPSRLVIHKTSVYWEDELRGFKDGLENISDYDFVSVTQQGTRLFREGQYPPLRGTHACIAQRFHVLYTMGFIPALRGYPRGYVPDPLVVTDHHGQSSPERICAELMALSKMNWNSADFAATEPITLKFAKRVGEIMTELPEGEEPKPLFKFYM